MADFELDDLITPVSRSEVQQSIYDVLAIVGVNTTSWKPGAVVRTMIVAASAVLASLSDLQAKIARSGFLQFAEGQWLTLLGRYVYKTERIEATFATGTLTLSNGGGGVFSFDPGDLIFTAGEGKNYRNVEAVSLGAFGSIPITIQAVEAGSGASVGAHEIDELVTVVLNVTCDNEQPIVGTDAESDAALRSRCLQKLGSLSPAGPWDAYGYAVQSATFPDGSSVGVTRLRITKDGYGGVTVFVADADGGVDGDVDDPATSLGLLHQAVQRQAVPVAVTAVVASAVEHAINYTYEVWLYDSTLLTEDEIKDAIEAAVVAFLSAQPVGGNVIGSDPGKIFVSALQTAIFNFIPEIFRVVVTVPAADVELDPEEVATPGTPTVVDVHLEPKAGIAG
ncbi:MAG TPA: baseplate J/gp47 family protein [Polyangiales bacterium]|nr:baseplate J/gp47 family protein [Polyangiales bacterium]